MTGSMLAYLLRRWRQEDHKFKANLSNLVIPHFRIKK